MGQRNHTTGEMTDGAVGTGTRVELEVRDENDSLVQALPPADPQNPTLGERLFYRVYMPELVDGSPSGVSVGSDAVHLSAAIIGVTGAQITAFKQVAKAMHDKARADKNLT